MVPDATAEPPVPAPSSGRALAAVVLAAGAGTRLRPLTRLRPKPLCPVGGVPLLDRALDRVGALTPSVAVNVHHLRHQVEDHLAAHHPEVEVSVEEPEVLGTAGALGQLRWWIDGRAVVVVNADTWTTADLAPLLEGWDGARVRVLVHGDGGFGPRARVVASLLPWSEVHALEAEPSGLYERCWAPAAAAGRLEAVAARGLFVDCGTPASYLAANLHAVDLAAAGGGADAVAAGPGSIVADDAVIAGTVGHAVVGARAMVAGSVTESVVWDGATVAAGEHLHRAVRADHGLTVLVR